MCVFTTVMFLLSRLIPELFVRMFTSDGEYFTFSIWAIHTVTLMIIPLGFQYVFVDGLTAMAKTKTALCLLRRAAGGHCGGCPVHHGLPSGHQQTSSKQRANDHKLNHPARLSDAVILPELPQNAAHFGRRFLYTENHSLQSDRVAWISPWRR